MFCPRVSLPNYVKDLFPPYYWYDTYIVAVFPKAVKLIMC